MNGCNGYLMKKDKNGYAKLKENTPENIRKQYEEYKQKQKNYR